MGGQRGGGGGGGGGVVGVGVGVASLEQRDSKEDPKGDSKEDPKGDSKEARGSIERDEVVRANGEGGGQNTKDEERLGPRLVLDIVSDGVGDEEDGLQRDLRDYQAEQHQPVGRVAGGVPVCVGGCGVRDAAGTERRDVKALSESTVVCHRPTLRSRSVRLGRGRSPQSAVRSPPAAVACCLLPALSAVCRRFG